MEEEILHLVSGEGTPGLRALIDEEYAKICGAKESAGRSSLIPADLSFDRADYLEHTDGSLCNSHQRNCFQSFLRKGNNMENMRRDLAAMVEGNVDFTFFRRHFLLSFQDAYLLRDRLVDNEDGARFFSALFTHLAKESSNGVVKQVIVHKPGHDGAYKRVPYDGFYGTFNEQSQVLEVFPGRSFLQTPKGGAEHLGTRDYSAFRHFHKAEELCVREGWLKENVRLVFDCMFPDNRLDDVIEELRGNPESPLNDLSAEQLWLVIARPDPIVRRDNEKAPTTKEASEPDIVDWSKYPEVLKNLELHALRQVVASSVRATTDLHPKRIREREAELLKMIEEWNVEGVLSRTIARLLLRNGSLYLLEVDRINADSTVVPKPIQKLHEYLREIEKIRSIFEDMYELGEDRDGKMVQQAQKLEAMYKAMLRYILSGLPEVELQLRHLDIRTSLDGLGDTLESVVHDPLHVQITSEVAGSVRQITDRLAAAEEVSGLKQPTLEDEVSAARERDRARRKAASQQSQ